MELTGADDASAARSAVDALAMGAARRKLQPRVGDAHA
jgi:hypothetical protein